MTKAESAERKGKATTPDGDSRTWELRPVFSWWHLLYLFAYLIILRRPLGITVSAFTSLADTLPHVQPLDSSILFAVTCVIWLHWAFFVNFLFLFSARRITLTFREGEPELEIQTSLLLEPRIECSQFHGFRLGWAGQLFADYRAGSRLWRWVRAMAIMPALGISRRQFADELQWKSFLNSVPLGKAIGKTDSNVLTSTYPPTYPEVPCPSCGLQIPAYEERCPNCATPRSRDEELPVAG